MEAVLIARSIESKIHSPVWFRNNTGRKVKLLWLNFDGDNVSYGVLGAQRSPLPMNTFVTHPWIAVDEENQQRMWLNSKKIFYPPTPQHVRVRRDDRVRRQLIPTNVLITVPVYNAEKLQDLCCQILAKTMNVKDIDELEIPVFLRNEIKKNQRPED